MWSPVFAGGGINLGGDGKAGTQPLAAELAGIEQDTHRHTLHNLGEVARRILGGMTLNTAPVPGARLATRPRKCRSGITSAVTIAGWPSNMRPN